MAKINKWIFWTPRILAIAFILFLAIFSLDVFDSAFTLKDILIGLFIHNIPSIVLAVVLLIAWKYELVGAIAFILAGIAYIIGLAIKPQFGWYMISWALTIAGPAFLIGILFFIGWKQKRNIPYR